MRSANFAPAYCALYPQLAKVVRSHGYALAVHGSMARDFDLVCIPWRERVDPPSTVLKSITTRFAIRLIGGADKKKHGRIAYTISIAFGRCSIDLSFFPETKT